VDEIAERIDRSHSTVDRRRERIRTLWTRAVGEVGNGCK
jgi:hypothetical protein